MQCVTLQPILQDHTLHQWYLAMKMSNPSSCQPALYPTSFTDLQQMLTQWYHMFRCGYTANIKLFFY